MIIIERNHVLNCSMFCILILKDILGLEFCVKRLFISPLKPLSFLCHFILLVFRSSLARFSSRSGDSSTSHLVLNRVVIFNLRKRPLLLLSL